MFSNRLFFLPFCGLSQYNIEIDESNVGDNVVVLPVKGIVLTVCAGVFALSLCSYLVFVLARKRKQKRESMTSQFCVEDHVW